MKFNNINNLCFSASVKTVASQQLLSLRTMIKLLHTTITKINHWQNINLPMALPYVFQQLWAQCIRIIPKAYGTFYFNESHKSGVIDPRLNDVNTIMC